MTFIEAIVVKIIGVLLTAVLGVFFVRKTVVLHKLVGFWNIGKTLIVISWFLKWGTLFLFSWAYRGHLPDQSIALMWLSCFLLGHYLFRPVGKLLIA